MSSTATSDQSALLSAATASPPAAPVLNIEAEIERTKALLNQLTKKKEEAANEQLKARDSVIGEFQKRYKLDARSTLAFLRSLDEAAKVIGAKSDAELTAALGHLGELLTSVNIPSTRDLAIVIRNRSAKSSKAKRLDKPTLDLLKKVLERGAKVPEVAKHFGLAEATVNARKKQWGLVNRKKVPLIGLKEALKGLV